MSLCGSVAFLLRTKGCSLNLQMGQRDLLPPGILDLTAWKDSWFILKRTKFCLVLALCKPSFLHARCPQEGKEALGKQMLKFVKSSATSPLLHSNPSSLQTPGDIPSSSWEYRTHETWGFLQGQGQRCRAQGAPLWLCAGNRTGRWLCNSAQSSGSTWDCAGS